MNKLKIATLGFCFLTVFGCATKQGTGGLIGAGGGAVLGAIIGKMAGNTAVGAAIGGAVGAGTGAIIGHHMDKVAAEAAKVN
ncbi:MAG: glycine zipper domain-containing protein, partial [Prevotella sp.]